MDIITKKGVGARWFKCIEKEKGNEFKDMLFIVAIAIKLSNCWIELEVEIERNLNHRYGLHASD